MNEYNKFNIKFLSVISYLGPLFIVGKFSLEKDEENVRFNVNQGKILFYLIMFLYLLVFSLNFFLEPFVETIEIITLLSYIGITAAWFILIIMGITAAIKGTKVKLPLVGRLANKLSKN